MCSDTDKQKEKNPSISTAKILNKLYLLSQGQPYSVFSPLCLTIPPIWEDRCTILIIVSNYQPCSISEQLKRRMQTTVIYVYITREQEVHEQWREEPCHPSQPGVKSAACIITGLLCGWMACRPDVLSLDLIYSIQILSVLFNIMIS